MTADAFTQLGRELLVVERDFNTKAGLVPIDEQLGPRVSGDEVSP